MKILVTGANGQVGWELVTRGSELGYVVVGLDRNGLDIVDAKAVENAINRQDVDLVVNAAAYTAVDKAESEKELAFKINRDGAEIIALACARAKVPLVHISTDYVFDGTSDSPYDEQQVVSPVGAYGISKEAGEQAVRRCLAEHVILRTAWVYGRHGHNFVKTMLRLGEERNELGVVADQRGCPTNAGDLTDAILAIAPQIICPGNRIWGTYHCCGTGDASWYEFAQEIFQIAGQYRQLAIRNVCPLKTREYPTPAIRPANSRLDCRRLHEVFGITMPHWRDSLATMLAGYLQ